MSLISAAIITYNEERNIKRCLDSLKNVADEIIVVDSHSNDQTKTICENHKVKFITNSFIGHVEQKNFAVQNTTHQYVLSLDADEVLSEELRESIKSAKDKLTYDAYSFNRRTNYCGQWINHSGWYPDEKLRLWNKNKGQWGGLNPHDKVVMNDNSTISKLKGDLLHYSYNSIEHHKEQLIKYTDIGAKALYKKGKKPIFFIKIHIAPILTFIKKYFLKKGFLDGYNGFRIARFASIGQRLKYIKLKRLYQNQS